MQKKNKIIMSLTSLIFIIAIVLTIRSRVATINNNELMKNKISSSVENENKGATKAEEDKVKKEEKSSEDATSSASEKEEATKDDSNTKVLNNKKRDKISNVSKKEETKLIVSNNIMYNKNFQSEENSQATSSVSIKEKNYLNSTSNLNKLINYTNFNKGLLNNNKKEDVISSDSKKINKITEIKVNKENSNKGGNKTVNLDKVKSKNDAVSSASKNKHKNTEIKNTNSFINKNSTKLIDLGWIKYIVVTFNEGTIKDYDLYVLDGGSYKAITPSNVDDSGKIVKWEIDKLGYNTIKVKKKNSEKEEIYKFAK